MRKKDQLVIMICLGLFMIGRPGLGVAQHAGHDPGGTVATEENPQPRAKNAETPCQRVARLAAELEEDFNYVATASDPSELQERLAAHKEKLAELRAATGICSQGCQKQRKRKGCGHMMEH